jgi:hypothetical protein
VHAALNNMQLADEVWDDPVRLGAVLLETYGDQRTVNDYRSELTNMRQQNGESVAKFFDRMCTCAAREYPGQAVSGQNSAQMYDVMAHLFINALRCANSKRMLILETASLKTLRDIKLRAQEMEACENRVAGRTNEPKNNLVSTKSDGKNAAFKNARNENKGRNNHASANANAGSKSENLSRVRCYNCGELGHKRDACPQPANNNENSSSQDKKSGASNAAPANNDPRSGLCFNCGQPGHHAVDCTQPRTNKSGRYQRNWRSDNHNQKAPAQSVAGKDGKSANNLQKDGAPNQDATVDQQADAGVFYYTNTRQHRIDSNYVVDSRQAANYLNW